MVDASVAEVSVAEVSVAEVSVVDAVGAPVLDEDGRSVVEPKEGSVRPEVEDEATGSPLELAPTSVSASPAVVKLLQPRSKTPTAQTERTQRTRVEQTMR